MLPGMCSSRAGGARACAWLHAVWRSAAGSNSATRLLALASAITSPAGPNAAAVTGAPSCCTHQNSAGCAHHNFLTCFAKSTTQVYQDGCRWGLPE